MKNNKIYRIYEGVVTRKSISGKTTDREMKWNKVIYNTTNYKKARVMYDRLVKEGCQNLLLVLDMGIMPTGEYIRQALDHFNLGTTYKELVPYVIISECLEGHDSDNTCGHEYLVTSRHMLHKYENIGDAMDHFMAIVDGGENGKIEETVHFSNDEYTRIRTIATAKAVRNSDKYHPCGTIKDHVIKYFEDWTYDEIEAYKASEATV